MTGPEHYRCAEDWMRTARTAQDAQRGPARDEALALAQYHATMAAAAASALGAIQRMHTDLQLHDAWVTLLAES